MRPGSSALRSRRSAISRDCSRSASAGCASLTSAAACELEAVGRGYGLLGQCELRASGRREPAVGASNSRLTPAARRDVTSAVIAVDRQACILCDRCIRACNDIQSNEVIGRAGKGTGAYIAFDLDRPMGESTCVSCGECAAACPTGALTHKPITLPLVPRSQTQALASVCPYCGVGCALTYH